MPLNYSKISSSCRGERRGSSRVQIRDLLKANPDRSVIKAKIWTEQRNTIESQGAHDPLIGLLVTLLLCRRDPRNDGERLAMQSLVNVLRERACEGEGEQPGPARAEDFNIESLKAALDRGDYKDKYVEIIIDNDSVPVNAWPLDEHGGPDFEGEEYEHLGNLADRSSVAEALEAALRLLGFENVRPA